MGIKATIKKENLLDSTDIEGKDLVISIGIKFSTHLFIGGDSTYLKSAGII